MRRNGFNESRDPILKLLETIECRDAILTPDGKEPDWPEADVVIGNPPFLGNKRMRQVLGDAYTEALYSSRTGSVPPFADLVCYWFDMAGRLVAERKLARAGLVATNSIRDGKNRTVLSGIVEHSTIYDAWPDEAWIVDGVSVRVSLVCFGGKATGLPVRLNGDATAQINADLTGGTVDMTIARPQGRNRQVAFRGGYKRGGFDIPGELAREWLRLPANPNNRPNSDVLKPWINGMDVTRRPADKWVIDFGHEISEADAALYEAPFAYVQKHVKPERNRNRRVDLRRSWWRHDRSGQTMFTKIAQLSHYIATPMTAKYRLFVWLSTAA